MAGCGRFPPGRTGIEVLDFGTNARSPLVRTGDWEIEDSVYPVQPARPVATHTACLHWLLPDWPWEVHHRTGDERFYGEPGFATGAGTAGA